MSPPSLAICCAVMEARTVLCRTPPLPPILLPLPAAPLPDRVLLDDRLDDRFFLDISDPCLAVLLLEEALEELAILDEVPDRTDPTDAAALFRLCLDKIDIDR
mmetsp:Transcript_34982/g.57088  ORF Transcript_34982/g.57088 Transcript_34982/m.57088 type:complete len:103 (-) Transcript_34982:1197-1505(-)